LDSIRNAAELKEDRNGHAEAHFADERREKAGSSKISDASVSGAPSWPVLAEEAYHGLPGDIVRSIEPHSEADPVAGPS
jgi:hypothetical protein